MEAIHRYRTFKTILFNYPPNTLEEAKFLAEIRAEFQASQKNTKLAATALLGFSSILWILSKKHLAGMNLRDNTLQTTLKLLGVSAFSFIGGRLYSEYDNCLNTEHYLMQVSLSRYPVARYLEDKLKREE